MILGIENSFNKEYDNKSKDMLRGILEDLDTLSSESSVSNIDLLVLDKLAEDIYLSDGVCVVDKYNTIRRILKSKEELVESIEVSDNLCIVYLEPRGIKIRAIYRDGILENVHILGSDGLVYLMEHNLDSLLPSKVDELKTYKLAMLEGVITTSADYADKQRGQVNETIKRIANGEFDKVKLYILNTVLIGDSGVNESSLQTIEELRIFNVVPYWEIDDTKNENICSIIDDFILDISRIYEDDCEYVSDKIVFTLDGIIYKHSILNIEIECATVRGIEWVYNRKFLPKIIVEDYKLSKSEIEINSITLPEPASLIKYNIRKNGEFKFVYSDLIGVIPYVDVELALGDGIKMCLLEGEL